MTAKGRELFRPRHDAHADLPGGQEVAEHLGQHRQLGVAVAGASALTNLTRGLMSGKHHASKEIQLPAVAGVDGVGQLADGRRVYSGALTPFGMMAERALISPYGSVELPEDVDSVTAAAVPNPGISAACRQMC